MDGRTEGRKEGGSERHNPERETGRQLAWFACRETTRKAGRMQEGTKAITDAKDEQPGVRAY